MLWPDTFQYPAKAEPPPGLPDFPIPDLSWLGIYPDQTYALPRIEAALHPSIFYTHAVPNLPIPELSWKALYPDIVYGLSRVESSLHQDLFLTLAVPDFPVPETSWHGIYPDELPIIQSVLHEPPAFVFEPEPQVFMEWSVQDVDVDFPQVYPMVDYQLLIPVSDLPIPELSWKALYPDQVYGLPRIEAALHESLFLTQAVPSLPVPDLSWKAIYQEEVYGLERRESALHEIFFSTNAVPDFPVPELSWKALYPEEVYGLRNEAALDEFIFYTHAVPDFPVPDTSWLAQYPDEFFTIHRTPHEPATYINVEATPPPGFVEFYNETAYPVILPYITESSISFVIPLPQLPIPELSWLANYPEVLNPPPYITPGWFELPLEFIEPPIPPEVPGGDQVVGGRRGRARRAILQPSIIRFPQILLQIHPEIEAFRLQVLSGIISLPSTEFIAQVEGTATQPIRTVSMPELDIAVFSEIAPDRMDSYYYRDSVQDVLNKRAVEHHNEMKELRNDLEEMIILGISDKKE